MDTPKSNILFALSGILVGLLLFYNVENNNVLSEAPAALVRDYFSLFRAWLTKFFIAFIDCILKGNRIP
jgi:hypothetical protein